MTVEEKLMNVDFSKFSKVQNSLLQRINELRRLDRERMDEYELDEVAAAGITTGIEKPLKFDSNKAK